MSDMSDIPPFAVPISGFVPDKAIHLCALFLRKSGGRIEKLKLVKLLYLTERSFFDIYDEPIMWDEFFSLQHGPVCSSALNVINKVIYANESDPYFGVWGRSDIQATWGSDKLPLDGLSEAEIEVAGQVWDQHGHLTASQIRNYTHDQCSEYVEIDRGRIPISYEGLLSALGHSCADDVSHEIDSYRSVLARYA